MGQYLEPATKLPYVYTAPYLLTYLLTPWCRVLLEKLTGLQLVKKFPAFYGTSKFITALTSVHQLSLSWASPIQSIYPRPTSWRSILILSTHLGLGLPSGLFPSGFPTKTLHTTISSPIRATCPAHLILLDFITRTILDEEYRPFSSSLCSLLHSPVTSSLLGPKNISFNAIKYENNLNNKFKISVLSSLRIHTPSETNYRNIVALLSLYNYFSSRLIYTYFNSKTPYLHSTKACIMYEGSFCLLSS